MGIAIAIVSTILITLPRVSFADDWNSLGLTAVDADQQWTRSWNGGPFQTQDVKEMSGPWVGWSQGTTASKVYPPSYYNAGLDVKSQFGVYVTSPYGGGESWSSGKVDAWGIVSTVVSGAPGQSVAVRANVDRLWVTNPSIVYPDFTPEKGNAFLTITDMTIGSQLYYGSISGLGTAWCGMVGSGDTLQMKVESISELAGGSNIVKSLETDVYLESSPTYVVPPVPEPGAMLVMGMGLASVATFFRRRK